MTLLVVGSVALDTLETPFGVARDALGGSATFFSLGARFFSPVRLVGVVGDDFPASHREVLASRSVDLAGLEVAKGKKTFRWHGKYEGAMNEAETLDVHLNVLGEFKPKVPADWRKSEWVFLANSSPSVQAAVLDVVKKPKFAMLDTMNLWIQTAREELLALLRRVDGVTMNDKEARMLANCENLIQAGRWIQAQGPRVVLVKKAEHGAVLFNGGALRSLPAYPLEQVKDPTGAGDSFAGGFMGYLAEAGAVTEASMGKALSYAVAVSSFTVEDFGTSPLERLTRAQVESRRAEILALVDV